MMEATAGLEVCFLREMLGETESYFARTEAPVVTDYQHSCQCISDSD